MRVYGITLLLLAGCAADGPGIFIAGPPTANAAAHLARMKSVIRQDALTSFGASCEDISLPERAFHPVEITGGGMPELAVGLGRARCRHGDTHMFAGTGGITVQFWTGERGPPRLILEQQMHGFTPAGDRLITMQHGANCPEGGGPDQCRVTYAWNDQDGRLEAVERRMMPGDAPEARMQYPFELLGY